MFEFQKRQVLDPSKPLLSTSSSTVLKSPLMFTTLGLGVCMLVVWYILARVDQRYKLCEPWKWFGGHLGKEFGDSGYLHHGLGGEGANSKAMFHWPHGPYFMAKGILKLVRREILDGHIAWNFSESWLLSLRPIDVMNHWAKCQTSCFASQAGLLEPIPFTFLESFPYNYPVLFCKSKPSICRARDAKNSFSKICYLS